MKTIVARTLIFLACAAAPACVGARSERAPTNTLPPLTTPARLVSFEPEDAEYLGVVRAYCAGTPLTDLAAAFALEAARIGADTAVIDRYYLAERIVPAREGNAIGTSKHLEGRAFRRRK